MKRSVPCVFQRTVSLLLSFFLTLTLTLTLLGGEIGLLFGNPDFLEQVINEESLMTERLEKTRSEISSLSESYGFSMETMDPWVNPEMYREFGKQVAAWTVSFMQNSSFQQMPVFSTEGMKAALASDPGFTGNETYQGEATLTAACDRIRRIVTDSMLPLREDVINPLLNKLTALMDPYELMSSVRYGWLCMLGITILLTGIIGLAGSRKLIFPLRDIGSAAAAAGIVFLALALLLTLMPDSFWALNALFGKTMMILRMRLALIFGGSGFVLLLLWLFLAVTWKHTMNHGGKEK